MCDLPAFLWKASYSCFLFSYWKNWYELRKSSIQDSSATDASTTLKRGEKLANSLTSGSVGIPKLFSIEGFCGMTIKNKNLPLCCDPIQRRIELRCCWEDIKDSPWFLCVLKRPLMDHKEPNVVIKLSSAQSVSTSVQVHCPMAKFNFLYILKA